MSASLPERHVLLDGCLNLRDLGGYRSVDTRQVRARCLFRSDELCALTTDDLNVIAQLGIRVVFDLRNDFERSRRPNRLPPGVEVLERTSPGTGRGRTLEEAIAAGDVPDRDEAYMTAMYMDMLIRLAPELRIIVERAASAAERPLLFHCAAGKDRTGIAAALLLGLLRVPEQTILDDYELTTSYSAAHRLAALRPVLMGQNVPEERIRPLLEARRPVLASTLKHINEQFGGFEEYAAEVLGVDPTLPERIRKSLLVHSN